MTTPDLSFRLGDIVAENIEAIQGCRGPHEFVRDTKSLISTNHRCRKCGGLVDAAAAHWYSEGLRHGYRERSEATE